MTDKYCVLLYLKDFTEKGNDRYFLFEDSLFEEISLEVLMNKKCYIVTHDFWLIANSIFRKTNTLPNNIVDITDLSRYLIQEKVTKSNEEHFKIKQIMQSVYNDNKTLSEYFEIFYKKNKFDINTYMLFSHKLSEKFENLVLEAKEKDEYDRFFSVEVKCYNILYKNVIRGLKIDNAKLKEYKSIIEKHFFEKLKSFSEEFDIFYELPTDKKIKEILSKKGFNVNEQPIDYILDLIPMEDDFGLKLRELERINITKNILNNMSHSSNRVTPYIAPHSTVTSRIYYKSPSLQNISKRYRDIFIPEGNKIISYIDYDQFEIGIMAFFSGDNKLAQIYNGRDIYSEFSESVFKSTESRSKAKKIFLSFTYGMSDKNLDQAVRSNGGDIKAARQFFSEFSEYMEWKNKTIFKFEEEGKISTLLGNYLKRQSQKDITPKEARSCISQVIQGTGSLIFKNCIISLSEFTEVDILIPMHDALLVQHPKEFDPTIIVNLFIKVMQKTLGTEKMIPKASISQFFLSAS